jgi:hypothetical protein
VRVSAARILVDTCMVLLPDVFTIGWNQEKKGASSGRCTRGRAARYEAGTGRGGAGSRSLVEAVSGEPWRRGET